MANYKKYPTELDTPSRLSRKHDRHTTFMKNKKANKVAKELRRLARLEKLQLDEDSKLVGGTD